MTEAKKSTFSLYFLPPASQAMDTYTSYEFFIQNQHFIIVHTYIYSFTSRYHEKAKKNMRRQKKVFFIHLCMCIPAIKSKK